MNDPNSPPHSVFRHPIFQSEDFALYRQEMAHHMVTFKELNEQKLQMDHPGIAARFDTLQNQLGNQQSMLNNQQSMLDNLRTMTVAMPNAVSAQLAVQLARAAATGVAGFASSLLAVPQESSPEETNDGSPAEPADSIRHLAMPPGTAPALCLVGAEMNRAPSSVTEIYNQNYGIRRNIFGTASRWWLCQVGRGRSLLAQFLQQFSRPVLQQGQAHCPCSGCENQGRMEQGVVIGRI